MPAAYPDRPMFDVVMGAIVAPLTRDEPDPSPTGRERLAAQLLADFEPEPAPAPTLTGWSEPPPPDPRLAELEQLARLACNIAGPALYQAPSIARALLAEEPDGPLAPAADALEAERTRGRNLDAFAACTAILAALAAR